jgi:hypothetical protein
MHLFGRNSNHDTYFKLLPKEDAQQLLGILPHTTAMSGLPACEPNFFNCA